MKARHAIKLTESFARNLAEIESFLNEAGAPAVFDALLDELLDTVIPNLQRFPDLGLLFLEQPARSVEVVNGVVRLRKQLASLSENGELREYAMTHYWLLYARIGGTVYLLSIHHHRQLSFDFSGHWS